MRAVSKLVLGQWKWQPVMLRLIAEREREKRETKKYSC